MAAAGNLEDTPTFSEFLRGSFEYVKISYHEVFVDTPSIKLDSWNISTYDIACIAVLIALFATLHYILDKYVFTPIAKHYDIPVESRKKVPEHAWRFIYFLCIWCWEWYVVDKYKFFQKPETMWHGWSLETLPPGDIYLIYVVQSSFFLFWTYATVFVDAWRKDSTAAVFHHLTALSLIFLSYATRCHNIGVVVLFLHDMCEIFLDFSKLCSYFVIQGLKVKKWIEIVALVGFVCFTVTWFASRLYWFPLKVIYSAAVHPQRLELNVPYNFLMHFLLLIHLVLNIYWFMWILKTFYRIAYSGRMEDPREVVMMQEKSLGQESSDEEYRNNILKKKH